MVAARQSLRPGSKVADRYSVLAKLGSGSNGQVYRAFDEHLGVEVAIKLLLPQSGVVATWDEAQILEHLRSEYLLDVINADIEPSSDIRYITTPVMGGGDAVHAAGPVGVDTKKASTWGQQIAHGLQRIHSAGLVHRDIKPANVYLTESESAVLGDLGMAAKLNSAGRADPDGTPVTAAPEVIAGEQSCSILSDIYSLAATVFFFLSGEYPVDHRLNKGELLNKVVRGERRKIRDLAPHVSQSLGQVVERNLSTDPTKRVPNALEFANQLASARHHLRNWRRSIPHPGHSQCFETIPKSSLKLLTVCVLPSSLTGQSDIQVIGPTGRHLRREERTGIPKNSLAAELRKLIARL